MFTNELPFPAVHGGRIDTWNRIRALKILGHNIFLIAWAIHEDNSKKESLNTVNDLVDELVCFTRNHNQISRLINITVKILHSPIQPNIVTDCSLGRKKYEVLKNKIKEFSPHFIWSDGIYTAKTASRFSTALDKPLFIRAHNIEHVYIKKLIVASKSLKEKIGFWGMTWNLKKYEFNVLKKATAFFDISLTDLEYWKTQGLSNGYWMPPIFHSQNYTQINKPCFEEDYDISFIGNLYSPNNVKSIKWFLENVLPLIRSILPNSSVLIAGFKPSEIFISFCQSFSNVTLISNPENINQLYSNSKILINPILSGSGVNIKTIEMLHQNKPIVCTSVAITGLPPILKTKVHIADNEQDFSSSIVSLLTTNKKREEIADHITKYFTTEYLNTNLNIIKELCKPYKSN